MINAASQHHLAWEAIFGPATESASKAMKCWTGGDVTMSLDDVREAALEDVAATLNLDDELRTLIVVGVAGDYGGQLILAFDDDNACQLIGSLLNREVDAGSWGELERSALQETGNILGSAFLNCITVITGCQLWPAPPYVTQDYPMSMVEQAVIMQSLNDDRVLLCRTRFLRRGERVEWNMVFVPSQAMLELLRTALSLPLDA
jgi:chemotaxis protein CheY-P-specific phosphatase CheC